MSEKSNSATRFDQQLTEALHPGPAPEDLRRSLLRAAASRGPSWSWHALGIAATLLLLLGSGAWGWLAHRDRHEGERFTRAALQNYVEVKRMDFVVDASTQDFAEQSSRWSAKAVGFSAPLPMELVAQSMKGGCACTMESCRVACYHLRDGRAVYVFDRNLKGLDADSKRRPLILASGHQASAWNEGGRGYILVEPPGWKPVG